MPQLDLVLLLVWVREEANPNARTANGDTHASALSSTGNADTDFSSNCNVDTHLDAHLCGYRHGHAAPPNCDLDTHFSGYGHGHTATSHGDDDGCLDAHFSSYGHSHAVFHCYLDAHLGGYEHGYGAALV